MRLTERPKRRGERLKHSAFQRLGIKDYRTVYEIDEDRKRVIVLFIGHRSEVYDDLSRLI
ncbi:MAG: type II toxin-antitoxin system RelE/ParE family toxin [Candidatus Bathyarchaeia archaeon]